MNKISIEDIRLMPLIAKNLLNTWADACSILLDREKHNSPSSFDISGHFVDNATLEWKSIKNKIGYEDLEQTTEFAGMGMALLIIVTFTKLKPISRRAKGLGVDFSLGENEIVDEDNFLAEPTIGAFLEAKGSIKKAYVRSQLNKGIEQSQKAIKFGLVYTVASEFETPSALTDLKSKK